MNRPIVLTKILFMCLNHIFWVGKMQNQGGSFIIVASKNQRTNYSVACAICPSVNRTFMGNINCE